MIWFRYSRGFTSWFLQVDNSDMMTHMFPPVSKNEFVFLFDLISENYMDKKKRQVTVSDNLSPSVHPQGLEPWTH